MVRRSILLTALFVFSLFSLSYGSVDVTVLNKTFLRSTGEPITESSGFPGQAGTATIKLVNGDLDDSTIEKVSSSIITLNGQILFSPSEFNQNVNSLEKQVALLNGQNNLQVQLKGKPGGRVTIKVIQTVEAEAAAVIGPTGGTIQISDNNSSISGSKIIIPAGSLNENVLITVQATNLSSMIPEGSSNAGPFVGFGPNQTNFSGDVLITIPYDDKNDDGIIDYSDTPETEILVASFDKTTRSWNYETIVSRDTVNNTITFSTRHFSDKVSTGQCSYSGKNVVVFTIDGLDLHKMISEQGSFGFFDIMAINYAYLRKSILEMTDLGLKDCDVISYSGPYTDMIDYSWDRNAMQTKFLVSDLVYEINARYQKAKAENKKFAIVTHSWGTILGILGLEYATRVNPDLFITLSSPIGTWNSAPCAPLDMTYKGMIEDFTNNRVEETYEYMSLPKRDDLSDISSKWINYWAKGDLISGPFSLTSDNRQVDEYLNNCASLSPLSLPLMPNSTGTWHAITSLYKGFKDSANLNEAERNAATLLINEVKNEIKHIIQTEPSGVIQLPQTGQIKCYDSAGSEISCAGTGQDGEYRAGVEWPNPRFTIGTGAESECIKDILTGLMWTRNGNISGSPMNWYQAIDYANNLNLCGYSDWRVPNVNELESLINANVEDSATWLNNSGFINAQSFLFPWYWSSTTWLYSTDHAWIVVMTYGDVGVGGKNTVCNLWPVRGGETGGIISLAQTGQKATYAVGDDGDLEKGVSWPSPRFMINGDCVTDNLTGLIWMKDAYYPIESSAWSQALDYANNLNLCNCTTWRIPNRKELFSLADHSQNGPALPTDHPFTNVVSSYYWSSTSFTGHANNTWVVDMANGTIGYWNKNSSVYVWPVCGGTINR